eukprot:2249854-Prymnesium_polylepis.1
MSGKRSQIAAPANGGRPLLCGRPREVHLRARAPRVDHRRASPPAVARHPLPGPGRRVARAPPSDDSRALHACDAHTRCPRRRCFKGVPPCVGVGLLRKLAARYVV